MSLPSNPAAQLVPAFTPPPESGLLLRQEGPVLHLTLNRPSVRNAMSFALVQALTDALAAAEQDGQTRVLVLRGAGGHFCAGADLKDMAAARGELSRNPQALAQTNARFGQMCLAFANTPLATVAVLEGTVMGCGFGLACVADVALAGADVQFRLPEATLGLPPAQIAPFLVERIGASETRRLAVTAARLNASQALALRLVHEVHLNEGLDAAVDETLRQMLQCAPGAVASSKALIARARTGPSTALIDAAAQAFSDAALGHEGMEGTLAFIQKRKATWMPTAA